MYGPQFPWYPLFMLDQVEFKPVPGLRNRSVSKCGLVIGEGGRLLSLKTEHDGYLSVKCNYHGTSWAEKKWMKVHRLVAMAWLPPPEFGEEHVHNINGIRSDNRVSNLAWSTPKANAIAAQGGDKIWRGSKLSFADARDVRARYVLGESCAAIARSLGVGPETIVDIVRWKSFDVPCAG